MRFDGTPVGDAIAALLARQEAYAFYERYYRGEHDLQRIVASLKVRNPAFKRMLGDVRENLCPIVVDALDDRLQLESIDCGSDTPSEVVAKTLRRWRFDGMQTLAHRSAMVEGDFYWLTWKYPGKETMRYAHPGHTMTVIRDEELPDTLACAVKLWRETIGNRERWRLTLYYPNRVERYTKGVTAAVEGSAATTIWDKARAVFTPVSSNTSGDWLPYDEDGSSVIVNPIGVVPVVAYHNNGFYSFGSSELRDVIPLQNALNKTILDSLVTGEGAAIPLRYIAGLDWDLDENGSPKLNHNQDTNTLVIGAKDVNIGQLEAADPAKLIVAIDDKRLAVSRISGVPAHYFMLGMGTGDFPSGESLKTAEARFTAKVKARQIDFGNVWEDLARLILRWEGQTVDALNIEAKWADTTPRNEKEHWETEALKLNVGYSKHEILRENGWEDADIDKMLKEGGEEATEDMERIATTSTRAFNSGGQTVE